MRARGDGSITYRKDKSLWQVAVSFRDRRVYRYVKGKPGKPPPEARRILAELSRQRETGGDAPTRLTLRAYLDGWLRDVRPNLAPATWRKHESIIRVHVEPWLGHIRLSELSIGDVRRWLSRPGGADGQTRRHHRATLRRALSDAIRDGLVARNVAALAEPPKLPHRERPFLTSEQARLLIDATREERLGPLYHLAIVTGMREAELLGLAWQDVEGVADVGTGNGALEAMRMRRVVSAARAAAAPTPVADARVGPSARTSGGIGGRSSGGLGGGVQPPQLHVRNTLHREDGEFVLREPKTAKSRRTIPLTAGAAAALRDHRRRQLTERLESGGNYPAFGLVFTTRTGHPMYPWHVLERLYAAEERLGLPRVGLHGLRHSTATILLASGMPMPQVAYIMGQSTIRTTQDVYGHIGPNDVRSAAAIMERAVG